MKEEKGKYNAPFEAQGEETGRCQRFAEFEADGFATEFTKVGTLKARGLGELCWVKARNYCVGELWELLDRI